MRTSSKTSLSGADPAPKHKLITVVVPVYNESEVIELFYERLKGVLARFDQLDFEILFVDDGSHDDSLVRLNRLSELDQTVNVCSFSRNFGHQIALTAGIDFARGDAVVLMDADLQHPPELIPEMIHRWGEGYDVVAAVRNTTVGASWMKNLTSSVFYYLMNFLSSTKIPRGVADFCLLSQRVCRSLQDMPERHRFLRGLISWAGFSRAFIPYEAPARAGGRTKYTYLRMTTMALDAVFSFSSEPLRLALRAGLLVTFLGFAYLAWTLIKGYLLNALVPGYASLIGVTLILGGCQLAFIGLIGQYLARVFEEVKGRPLYLFRQEPPQGRLGEPERSRGTRRHAPSR